MISDEVRMLGNRIRSNPEEFYAGTVEFGNRPIAKESRKWDSLMNSLVNNKPDMDILFTPEEIKYLRDTLKEVLRPMALATIVKTIVGGEDVAQMELDLEDSTVYNKRTLITQADLLRMRCDAEYLKMKQGYK
jgi:hypothetical protein